MRSYNRCYQIPSTLVHKILEYDFCEPTKLDTLGLLFLSMWLHGNLYHLISNMWFLFHIWR